MAGQRQSAELDRCRPEQRLREACYVVLDGRFAAAVDAWAAAGRVVATAAAEDALCRRLGRPLTVLAEYRMPPPGTVQRDFQALHVDFGVPLGLDGRVDAARYTVLYVDAAIGRSTAATRVVPVERIARQRRWPASPNLAERLRHRELDADRSEGVLARVIDAADGAWELPAKAEDFLCGMEFESLGAERDFFARHGVDLHAAEEHIVLVPGQAMVLDNLRCAHGRLGVRRTEELHQRCLGVAGMACDEQDIVLDAFLDELTGSSALDHGSPGVYDVVDDDPVEYAGGAGSDR